MVSTISGIRPWQLLAVGVLVVLLLGAWCLHRGADAAQADATFGRIQSAIANRDAAGVVHELHPRYEFTAMWPHAFESAEDNGMSSQNANPRALAQRGIAFIFLQSAGGLHMDYQLQHIVRQADGSVALDATIEVRSVDGGVPLVSGRQAHHFILAWDGWFLPKLRVLAHDAIDVKP
jgi:hypothetical protein